MSEQKDVVTGKPLPEGAVDEEGNRRKAEGVAEALSAPGAPGHPIEGDQPGKDA